MASALGLAKVLSEEPRASIKYAGVAVASSVVPANATIMRLEKRILKLASEDRKKEGIKNISGVAMMSVKR